MTFTHKTLGQASIGSATTIGYTVPAATQSIVKAIWIANTGSVDATVELWNAGSNIAVADSNKLMDGFTIPGNDFTQVFTDIGMETVGDTIQAKGSINLALTLNLYGAEIV